MAITVRDPNTIYLGGGDGPGGESGCTIDNDYVTFEAVTPGHLLERYNDAGTLKWRKHATADNPGSIVALEQIEHNLTINDAYGVGDLLKAGILRTGSTFLGFFASGQTVTKGSLYQSAGNGTLKASTGGERQTFVALETLGAVTALSRARMEVA